MKRKSLTLFLVLILGWLTVYAQNQKQPIIDVHLHAQSTIWMKTMPCTPQPCEGSKTQISDISELLPQTVSEMKEHNVVLGIVTYNDLEELKSWKSFAPGMFYTGIQFWNPLQPDISIIQEEFSQGRVNIIGEIGTQYYGFSPNDPKIDKFYELAVELDVPVLIHCAALAGKSELFNITDGNPLLLEPVLKKYPSLRIYVENAGYPFSQEMIALMNRYSTVYVDVSTVTWLIPREAFHKYLEELVIAGYGKRIMFGSDQMIWPEAIGMGIEAINSADFLSFEQKRDILYNNAARFLRLSEEVIAEHHQRVNNH